MAQAQGTTVYRTAGLRPPCVDDELQPSGRRGLAPTCAREERDEDAEPITHDLGGDATAYAVNGDAAVRDETPFPLSDTVKSFLYAVIVTGMVVAFVLGFRR